uniref:Alanine and glycine-rich protein-like n=1 Tax=Callorhinus ursinus TaxID=34884 RepID=A0A3Q7NMZ7_CALUR|nr:alanine and glycine-rich protein-like [Callorhinus ursinus]
MGKDRREEGLAAVILDPRPPPVVVRSLAARFPRPRDPASAGAATTAATSGGSPGGSRWVGGGPGGSSRPTVGSAELGGDSRGQGAGVLGCPLQALPRAAPPLSQPGRPCPLCASSRCRRPQRGFWGYAAGLDTRRPLGSWGPGRPGFTSRPPGAARPSGGASARPQSRGRPPLPFALSRRNLPIILPPRLEPCATRARNKHHI